MFKRTMRAAVVTGLLVSGRSLPADAASVYVAAGGTGNGTAGAPFGRIQQALDAAQAGDTVIVASGTYGETLRTVRGGSPAARITVRAAGTRGSVLVHATGRVLTVAHAYVTVEGLVLDGNYGADDVVRVSSGSQGFTLRNSEVRRSSKDGVDIDAPTGVLIEDSLIHHTLNAAGGRTDAHGIAAGSVRGLTISRTEIHTFSGDAIQVDPGRAAPGWNDVVIDGCKLWLAPLPSAENGFAAGVVPGENALDTKADSSLPRARITIRNTEAWGFRRGLISNMAAFNLKENIDALVDGATVRDSEIGFRMRGPASEHPAGAWVRVQNTVVHSTVTAFRYEDNIQNLRIWNVTVGGGVTRAVQAANAPGSVLDLQNLLMLGSVLPGQAVSSLAVGASAFVDASKHNYQLAPGAPALDTGSTIAAVSRDRQGTARPQGRAYDIGAFERIVSSIGGAAPADVVLYAARAPVIVGNWSVVADASAAGGLRMTNPDQGEPKLTKAVAAPDTYFELAFDAVAGRPYRLWLRGRAQTNDAANDAVFVQFSSSVDANGAQIYRTGTSSATPVNLGECGTCAPAGWGWQDNGSGGQSLGPVIYFATTGPQTVRIQPREDGLAIDQIVLSSSAYLLVAPGAATRDSTVLVEEL